MSIVLDLIIVLIVMMSILISAKKGFVRSVISVAGFVAAIVLAFTFSTPLSELTYDKAVEPTILKAVSVESEAAAEGAVKDSWQALPDIVKKGSEFLGITEQSFNASVSGNITNGAKGAVATASQKVIRPVAVKVFGMLYSVVISLILIVVFHFVGKVINKLFSFSVIGKVNRTLGGILGIVKGCAIAVLFCMIISIIIPFTQNGFLIFTPENIEGSVVFKALANLIPFSFFKG